MWDKIEQLEMHNIINKQTISLKTVASPHNRGRLLTFILASIILLYFIFAPGINGTYYAADDFRYAFGGYNQSCKNDDGFEFMLTLGRPLQAYLDCINYKFAYTMERMSIARLISVFLMGCGMGLLAEYFFCLGLSFWAAFFAAGCVFLIPHLYGDAVFTSASSLPFSLVLALLGYRYVNKIGLASALIFCALLTYPATTFIFPSLIMAKLLFSNLSDWARTQREALQESILFIAVCTIYFIWSYYNMRYHALAPVPDQYRLDHPNLSLTEVIKRLVLLGNVFNPFWELIPGGNMIRQGWLMLGVFATGAICGALIFFKSVLFLYNKKRALIQLAQVIAGVAALFILSSAFILIIPDRDNGGSPRLLFGVIAAGLILVFWSIHIISAALPLKRKSNIAFMMVALLFLTQAHYANLYTQASASRFIQKIDNVKTLISGYLHTNKPLRRIHFVLTKPDYPYNKFFLANGGLMQVLGRDNYTIKWCSLPRGVPEDEPNHQQEAIACIDALPKNGIGITYSYKEEPFKITKDMLIINKNNYI